MRRYIFSIVLFFCILSPALAKGKTPLSDTKLIFSNQDKWVYEAIQQLQTESGITGLLDRAPLSMRVLKNAMAKINYEKLSESSRQKYDQVMGYLNSTCLSIFETQDQFYIGINGSLNFEFFKDTDNSVRHSWDYIHRYNNTLPAGAIPFYFKMTDYVFIETSFDKYLNYNQIVNDATWTNFYFDFSGYWDLPRNAYINFEKSFNSDIEFCDNSTFSFVLARNQMQIGIPVLDSIILSDNFITDAFFDASYRNDRFHIDISASQIETDKYLYLHHLGFKFLDNFSLSLLEGTLVNGNFELRFLNPIMVMHSFAAARDETYGNQFEHTSSYFGLTFEFVPVKNLYIYGLYAQNELQFPGELSGRNTWPNGLAGQAGISYSFPSVGNGSIKIGIEEQYLSPWCYLRFAPGNSFFSDHIQHYTKTGREAYSWIGSQYGPDTFSSLIFAKYDYKNRWSVSLSYEMLMHGDKDLATLLKYKDEDGYYYYPASESGYGKAESPYADKDEAYTVARSMLLTDTIEYNNIVSVSFDCNIFKFLSVGTKVSYKYIINARNISDRIANDFEFNFYTTVKSF